LRADAAAREEEYAQIRTRDVAVSTSLSTATFGVGTSGSVGVNIIAANAAANAGELGQALLSGGAGVGLFALLASLQSFTMVARLPVYHAHYVYNLADGFSWAQFDFGTHERTAAASTTGRRLLASQRVRLNPLYHVRERSHTRCALRPSHTHVGHH